MDEGVVVGGRIWVHPKLARPPGDEIDNTLRHELGHTLGLGALLLGVPGPDPDDAPTRFDAQRGSRRRRGCGPRDAPGCWSSSRDAACDDACSMSGHRGRPAGTVLLLTVDGVTDAGDGPQQLRHQPGWRYHEVCAAVERDGRPDGTCARPRGAPTRPARSSHRLGPVRASRSSAGREIRRPAAPITVVVTRRHAGSSRSWPSEAHEPASHPAHGIDPRLQANVPTDPGEHTVCVTARNVGDGADVSLGCRWSASAASPSADIGLQTI